MIQYQRKLESVALEKWPLNIFQSFVLSVSVSVASSRPLERSTRFSLFLFHKALLDFLSTCVVFRCCSTVDISKASLPLLYSSPKLSFVPSLRLLNHGIRALPVAIASVLGEVFD